MRLKRLLPIAIGGGIGGPILIFIVIVVVYPNLFVHGFIMHAFEEEFGGRATAEDFSFSWRRGVEISKLLVRDKDDEQPILTADSINIKFKILPLLKDELIIERLDINRPELVLHRGGGEGRGYLGLGAIAGMAVADSDEASLPMIMEVRIIDGTIIFGNLSTGESTGVENLNLRSSGIQPGGTALIDGEFDVIGVGSREHAVISGSLRGLEEGSLDAVQADLNLDTSFAEIKAAVDMRNLSEPGKKVAKVFVNVELQEMTGRIGALLELPDGLEIRGSLDSEVDAIAQPDGSMLFSGTASSSDLYIKASSLFDEPIQAAQAVSSYKVVINPKAGQAKIESFALNINDINMDLSGDVHADGALDTNVYISAPLEELAVMLGSEYRLPDDVTIVGNVTSNTEIRGTLGDSITFKGSSTVTGLDFIFKSFEYTDPKFTVEYDLDYDHEKGLVNVRSIEASDGFFAMKLEQFALELRRDGHYQGELDIMTDMLKLGKLLKVQEFLGLKGVGEIDLTFVGNMEPPFYKGLRISGTLGLDKSLYEDYEVANIRIDEAVFEEDRLNVTLHMLVNGAPAEVVLDLDPAEGAVNIKKFLVRGDKLNLAISGEMSSQGRFNAVIGLSAGLDVLKDKLAEKYEGLGGLAAIGETKSNIELEGTIGGVITLNGSTMIEGLNLEYETYKYADPDITLQYELDYNYREKTAHIRKATILSDILASNLENVSVALGDEGRYRGELSLDCDVEEIYRSNPLFPFLVPKGQGRVDLDFRGTIEGPFYKDLNASGYMAMDKVVWESSNINIQATNIITEEFSVVEGHFTGNTTMLVNGSPANGRFDVDLALGMPGGPYIGGAFHMTGTQLTYTMEGGDVKGVVTLDVDDARVEGLKWDETFKKTLTAKGQVKVEEGEISATELLSTVFLGLGKPGVTEYIKLIESDFEIRDEKIYTKEFHLDGAPFHFDLSGWLGFDGQLDYDAVILLSSKMHKGVQKVFRKVIKDSPVPLKITGNLSDPEIKFTGGAKLKSVLIAEKVLQGQEAIVRGTLGVPKKAILAPKGVLEGVRRLFGSRKKDADEAADDASGELEAPTQPLDVE